MDLIKKVIKDSNLHEKYNGYTGNCANIAVAIKEVALEEFKNDKFRFAVVDRPSKLNMGGIRGPDHIALEYNGKYLDSKGVHSREELIKIIQGESQNNKPVVNIESRLFVENLPYYSEKTKDEIKLHLKNNL